METSPAKFVAAWEAILLIVVTFFSTILLGVIFLVFLSEGIAAILGELLFLILPLAYLLLKGINVKNYVQINLHPKYILIGLAFGVILLAVDILATNALIYLLGNSQAVQDSNETIIRLASTTPGLIEIAASLALAGICEEFAFRGFLQNALTRNFRETSHAKYAFLPAILISAAAFGIFHFDPQGVYMISAFISGAILGLLYYKWNNYVVPAIAHTTLNIVVFVLLILGY